MDQIASRDAAAHTLPHVWGTPEGYDGRLLAQRRAEHTGSMLHVARDDARLARLAEAIGFFGAGIEIVRVPAWDCLPYDRVSPNAAIVAERAAALARLAEPAAGPRIVLTTASAILQRVPPRSFFRNTSLDVEEGSALDTELLTEFLVGRGYNRAETVREPGEFAVRGGIVDIYPAGEGEPVRLDLFGDEVENIRRFDPATQRSGERLARGWRCTRWASWRWTSGRPRGFAPPGARRSARRRRMTASTRR